MGNQSKTTGHGQFGESVASDVDRKSPADESPTPAPKRPATDEADMGQGQHQEQAGMRS